jgi:hypothetical protein
MREKGYMPNRLGFPETGYSTLQATCYWQKAFDRRYYCINVICNQVKVHESIYGVADDFGDLVKVTP